MHCVCRRTKCTSFEAGICSLLPLRLFATSARSVQWQPTFLALTRPSLAQFLPASRHIRRLPSSYLTIRMVEGHQCHRVGHAHRKQLLGQRFKAQSPNGRFVDGAKAIDEKVLSRIEVHGKNLFYFFGAGPSTVVVQVHFGMSGAFKTLPRDATLPETKPTTRLLLIGQKHVGLLSAMTVAHGGLDFYEEKVAKLGPDPLREDADAELLWARMQRSKAPVGLILMQQDAVAGIGNIYRAEILFKAGVHPEVPGHAVERAAFERIWRHSVDLLRRGFKSGSILTVDPAEAAELGPPWQRRYIYNHKTCGRCSSAIRTWSMAARTCYACETCQAAPDPALMSAPRSKALAAATGTKVFKSHCAPEPASSQAPAQLTVQELKAQLKGLGQAMSGRKAELVQRLEAALEAAGAQEAAAKPEQAEPEQAMPDVVPGMAGLGEIASAEEAALEKAAAGEGRDVEHVALETEGTLQLAAAGATSAPPRRRRARPGMHRGADEPGAEILGEPGAGLSAATGLGAAAAGGPDEPLPTAAGGRLNLRKRKAAAGAAAATSGRAGGKAGVPGKAPAVGLDVPYKW